jgi:hypothetical protein
VEGYSQVDISNSVDVAFNDCVDRLRALGNGNWIQSIGLWWTMIKLTLDIWYWATSLFEWVSQTVSIWLYWDQLGTEYILECEHLTMQLIPLI